MNIQNIKLPPVSRQFYDRLVEVYPPINPLDIKKDTNMIDIQRNAAQQEVIQFIKNAVRKEQSNTGNMTFWERLKYVINH